MTVNVDEVDKLRAEIETVSLRICEQLPTLLALLDFRQTQDIRIVRERQLLGWYGEYAAGKFTAPTLGPYVGFLSDMDEDRIRQMKEALFGG